jgi:uncharacterized protein YodC (DUF2158 family)
MHAFRAGNLVRHRSGGPIMMVERVGWGSITCIWVENCEQKYGKFHEGTVLAVYADGSTRDYNSEG